MHCPVSTFHTLIEVSKEPLTICTPSNYVVRECTCSAMEQVYTHLDHRHFTLHIHSLSKSLTLFRHLVATTSVSKTSHTTLPLSMPNLHLPQTCTHPKRVDSVRMALKCVYACTLQWIPNFDEIVVSSTHCIVTIELYTTKQ